MNKEAVIGFFGSEAATAKILGISCSAVNQWKSKIPMRRAYELHRLTKGKLKIKL